MNYHLRLKLLVCVIIFSVIACGIPAKLPERPAPVAGAAPVPPLVVIGNVNVRTCPAPDCQVIGWLLKGETVRAECKASWCAVDGGYVFAPCLTGQGVCK
jgi:hypothetical protein